MYIEKVKSESRLSGYQVADACMICQRTIVDENYFISLHDFSVVCFSCARREAQEKKERAIREKWVMCADCGELIPPGNSLCPDCEERVLRTNLWLLPGDGQPTNYESFYSWYERMTTSSN